MVLIGAKFQVSLSNVVLIGTKCLVFPQQRCFDWYAAKFYVSPSNAVLNDVAILHGTYAELSFIRALPLTCELRVYLRRLMPRCLYIVYKSVLSVFTQEFSLVVWLLMCDGKMNPKKIGQCRYFSAFWTDQKIKKK